VVWKLKEVKKKVSKIKKPRKQKLDKNKTWRSSDPIKSCTPMGSSGEPWNGTKQPWESH